jgi:hypothetical protein
MSIHELGFNRRAPSVEPSLFLSLFNDASTYFMQQIQEMIASSSRLLFKNLISKIGGRDRQQGDFISLLTEIGVGGIQRQQGIS